jgi:REP element-mobilizing transposase RayT
MSSYRQILYHIIFRTKDGKKTLAQEPIKELYAYILGIVKAKNCFLYRINGMEDHIHLLCDLHPSIALANYVRDIKTASSLWLKQHGKFPAFEGWAEGYAALTYAWRDKDMIVDYIRNQQEHHKKETFEEEYRRLLEDAGIKIDDRYFP